MKRLKKVVKKPTFMDKKTSKLEKQYKIYNELHNKEEKEKWYKILLEEEN